MKYEEVLTSVGKCGRYQICILNLLYICTVFDGLHIGSMVFIIPQIKHRCAIPDLPNDTYEIQSEAHAKMVQEYIPEEMVDGTPVYSKCHLYANKTVFGNQTTKNCMKWVYDKSIFQSTLTTEFNFVCGNEWIGQQIFTIFFAGYLSAKLFCGLLSDRFGRKTVIIGAVILQGVAGILSSQLENYKLIFMFRFLTAIGGASSYLPSIVYGTEISSMENRTAAAIIIQIYFTFGYFVISLLTYLLRSWRILILLISLPSIPTALFYIWAIPESPRWLLIQKKDKEAAIILNKIAKFNKKDFDCTEEKIEISVVEDRTVRFWRIFLIPKFLIRTIILAFNWCSVSFVYYGLMLNTEHLSGNIFLNFFLGALVEVPAYLLCIALLNRFGRKRLYIAYMFIGGICAVITIFPMLYASKDFQWTATFLAIFSRLCITGTFGTIYLHTCELYPTCVRNGSLGLIAAFAKVGGVIAPYIMSIRVLADGKIGESLPLVVMGMVCILAGMSYLLLPETNQTELDDTFADALRKNSTDKSNADGDLQLENRKMLNENL